jgi:phospholipid transport system substrate-binding protein
MFFSKTKSSVFLLLISFILSFQVLAVVSPVKQYTGISNRLLSQLKRNQSQLHNQKVIHRIVRRHVLPHFNQNQVSASVIGRRYWSAASGRQKQQFKRLFASLVINTYASAFKNYRAGDQVQFIPLRVNYKASRFIALKTLLIRTNGQRVRIVYNLMRSGSSWKIYDFSIAGVSMVQSYRAQFSGVLARRGLPGLISRLKTGR